MSKDLETHASEAVSLARKAGASDAWAAASRDRSVSFRVRDGKLEEVKDATSRGLVVRLFVAGRYSSHATTDLRPEMVRRFVAEAVAMTRALQPDAHRIMPDPALFAGRPSNLDLADARVPAIEREQRLAWCHAMDKRTAGKPGVVSAESTAEDNHSITVAVSSNGFVGAYEATQAGYYVTVTMADGDKRPEDWQGAWARHLDELPAPETLADEALELARARLGTAKGPTRRTTMVVDHRAAGSLVSRLLGPAWGGAVQQERSYFRGRLGKQVAAKLLTVIDDPVAVRGLGSRPFDSEGIAARRMPLIEGGVLRNYYLSTYYAHKLGMKPTTGEPSNRVVEPGSRSRDQLLAEAGSGIYVSSWLGGNMDSTTGDFSYGVAGHLIENGRLGAPVAEMNVTGNMLELFARLGAVGNDPWLYSSTQVPTLVFDGVQFSGV